MRKQIVKHKLGRYFETGIVGSAGAMAAVLYCTSVLAQSAPENPPAVQTPRAASPSGESATPPASTQAPSGTSQGQPSQGTQDAQPTTGGTTSGQLPPVDIRPGQQKPATQQTKLRSAPARQSDPRVTVRTPKPVSAPASASGPRSNARRSGSRVSAAPSVNATPSGESPSGVPNPPLNATGDGSVGYVASRTTVGTKTNTPLIEIPQSISVITKSQLETQNPQTVKDALLYTAGVAADQRSSLGGYDIVYSRGFVVDRFWDEMKILGGSTGFTTPQVDPYALQRIEVLRGPSSVLYGYNSPGGILNLVSRCRPLRRITRWSS
jgi:TonB-dependent Receptor Plug Domain